MGLSSAPQVPGRLPDSASLRPALVAALVYAALVLVMWLPFNPCGGMPYESHFLFNSEVWPIKGILFPSDPMRPHTSTFYHVAFLLGEVLRIGGSFVPFQIVYAVLWWARGFLLFLIARRMLPGETLFAYCCGALLIVHASDRALMWVGQLNQFGFIFWMLLAFYLFLLAVEAPAGLRRHWRLAGTLAAQHMSLWSYESQLLLILAAPLTLWFSKPREARPRPAVFAAWYIMPAIYVLVAAALYLNRTAGDYQASVLRKDWSAAAIASDWWFNITASLEFWKWSDNLPWSLSPGWLSGFGLLGAVVYVAGWCGVLAVGDKRKEVVPFAPAAWLGVLLAGLAALALSFPAYLLLQGAALLWRTQFLSGIGSALTLASLAGLAASILPGRWLRASVFLAVGALVAVFGVAAALRLAASHDEIWSRQRQAVEALLSVAPRLPERAVVLAVNVPKANDPFGHNMWFNFALKLAYPGSRVSGVYFYDNGAPADGNHLHLESTEWVWDRSFESPGYQRQGVEKTLAISYDSLKTARILEELPALVSPQDGAQSRYSPRAVVLDGLPSPRAVRRYFPCPDWWWTLSPKPD
jgi:hypothetical protein